MIKKLQLLKQSIPEKTAQIIKSNAEVKKAKIEEFRNGKLPDGKNIGDYAVFFVQEENIFYDEKKHRMNQRPGFGNVDLILTGDFTNGLFVEEKSGVFLFDSTDLKADKLFGPRKRRGGGGSYGPEARGLNEKTWLRLQREEIAPELKKFIQQQIGQR